MCVCVHSQAAESAETPSEASVVDTTATPSIGVPADTEEAVAAGMGVEVLGDGAIPAFLGATTTLLWRYKTIFIIFFYFSQYTWWP